MNDTQHNAMLSVALFSYCYVECYYAVCNCSKCYDVIRLSVIKLSVVAPSYLTNEKVRNFFLKFQTLTKRFFTGNSKISYSIN
jgi:hypothetical protein